MPAALGLLSKSSILGRWDLGDSGLPCSVFVAKMVSGDSEVVPWLNRQPLFAPLIQRGPWEASVRAERNAVRCPASRFFRVCLLPPRGLQFHLKTVWWDCTNFTLQHPHGQAILAPERVLGTHGHRSELAVSARSWGVEAPAKAVSSPGSHMQPVQGQGPSEGMDRVGAVRLPAQCTRWWLSPRSSSGRHL